MPPGEATLILYVEVCEAFKRAALRIGRAPCEAPAEAVVAAAIAMFLDKSPATKRLLRDMLNKVTEATQLRSN